MIKKKEVFGSYCYTDNTVFVNVPYIWESSNKDIDKFIHNFNVVLTHEELHKVIHSILGDKVKYTKKRILVEEDIIESMLPTIKR